MHRLERARYIENVDPRELAIYTPTDAARYLGIKESTLKSWIYGRTYPKADGTRGLFAPLIKPADPENRLLSFFNLAEAHVLAATRYEHEVRISAIRRALDTLREKYPSEHPLISRDFFTNGEDLFIKTVGENENLSRPGQLNLKKIMDKFLAHIGRDRNKIVDRVFPIIKGLPQDETIGIIHGIASGQPVLTDSRVPVWIIHSRYSTGEKKTSIARDFGLTADKVQRAIDYVEKRAA
ncbi:MAG TPA: DUF433 domain-containing protein [Candidatus Sulfotelmatobacter sp.]|nr:DUF433 domain-containing protein [Candidatus Sulfotelmatobacter sp.]